VLSQHSPVETEFHEISWNLGWLNFMNMNRNIWRNFFSWNFMKYFMKFHPSFMKYFMKFHEKFYDFTEWFSPGSLPPFKRQWLIRQTGLAILGNRGVGTLNTDSDPPEQSCLLRWTEKIASLCFGPSGVDPHAFWSAVRDATDCATRWGWPPPPTPPQPQQPLTHIPPKTSSMKAAMHSFYSRF
jgi:hypothetical protein